MSISEDYLEFPGSATIGQVLGAYIDRQAQWWWLLITEIEGEHKVCSFGSLLPYLTGRTPHIVHSIGDCPICCAMDPLLWSDTGTLVAEVLTDEAACSRRVSDLPMVDLPVIEAKTMEGTRIEFWLMEQGLRACGVTEDGTLSGVYILQYRGVPGGLPDF